MKRASLIFLAVACSALLVGCQEKESVNVSASAEATTATASDSVDQEERIDGAEATPNLLRTVHTIDMDVILGAFQQVCETDQYAVTVVEEDKILTTNDGLGNTWTVYGFPTLDEANEQFSSFVDSFESRKETTKDLTQEEMGEGVERSMVMLSEKNDYVFQVIQQDNMVIAMEGTIQNKEVLYAFVTEYFYAISPYLPESLAEEDALYLPDQNELIDEVGKSMQVVVDELGLPDIKRENTTSDVFGQDKNVTILTENENFALRVSVFETEEAAQAYAEETNQFYNEFGVASTIKEDAFGKRYIFMDLGMGEYNELIVDGQTVITAIELNGDQTYAENAIAIYSDAKSQLATPSSDN